MKSQSNMFAIDAILLANLTGELNFDRSYIRLRRGHQFKVRSWEDIEPVPGQRIQTDPTRGMFHLLHWISRRNQIDQLYIQGKDIAHLPPTLKKISHLNQVDETGALILVADSLPVETPPKKIRTILILRTGEEIDQPLAFDKVFIQMPLIGISTPLLRNYGQNTIFLPPWMQVKKTDSGLQIWDLANPLPHLCVGRQKRVMRTPTGV